MNLPFRVAGRLRVLDGLGKQSGLGKRSALGKRSGPVWPPPAPCIPPPPAPAGWTAAPPDFVGVGVQKAGTSWWYALIAAHPEVAHATGRKKEVHFFNRFWNERWTDADAGAYAQYFPRPSGHQAGEWTPRYLSDWWAPPLVKAAAPAARILVLLRDPVERYRSALAHYMARNAPVDPLLAELAFPRGLYHHQLVRLLESFDRRQVLILQYERCLQAPAAELRRTFAFLGLDDAAVPAEMGRKWNETRIPKPQLDGHGRESLGHAYREDCRRLFTDFPELDPELWPNVSAALD